MLINYKHSSSKNKSLQESDVRETLEKVIKEWRLDGEALPFFELGAKTLQTVVDSDMTVFWGGEEIFASRPNLAGFHREVLPGLHQVCLNPKVCYYVESSSWWTRVKGISLFTVLAHEMAHSFLGEYHSPRKGSIMYHAAGLSRRTNLSEGEREEAINVYKAKRS